MLSFLEKLFDNNDLYPFEKAIFQSVISRLDHQTRLRLQSQIEVVNKIQRMSDGKEVNLYRIHYGRAAYDDRLRFPNAPAELLLAIVELISPNGKAKLTAKVWMAEGRLFSLEFNTSPKQFFAGISLKNVRPEIIDVKIFCDRL